MTVQCKSVLRGLKGLCNNTDSEMSYLYGKTCICLLFDTERTYNYSKYCDEITSILSALADEGYLRFTDADQAYRFQLTQKALHQNQVTVDWIKRFLLDNLIAILALIVAIIALFK